MGLFKKKDAVVEEIASEDVSPKKDKSAGRKKKRASGMAEILHESVLETVLDTLRANDAFIRYENGQPCYVGLILNVADIGGLDKRSRRNEAKGSIIELINSGSIKTYVTEELMDEGMLCIIPDTETLTAMEGYGLFTDATYEFCQIDESGGIELLGVKTTFNQVSDLVCEDGHIDDILGDAISSEKDDGFFGEGDASEQENTSGDALAGSVEDDPEADPDAIEDMEGVEAIDDETLVTAVRQAVAASSQSSVGSDAGTAGDDEWAGMFDDEDGTGAGDMTDPYAAAMAGENDQEQTIPSNITEQAVIRRFYTEDLGLEVTAEPFDAQFLQGNPYVPFPTDRDGGWLDEQLNEKSRAANLELERQHSDNLFQMRGRFFRLVSMACDRIRSDLDIHNPDTQYGQLYEEIGRERDEALESIDDRVVKRKADIDENWRQRLQDVGMEAARAAQHQYRERYGRQHDLDVYNIEASERAAIEDQYQDALAEMYKRRRIEAASLLDLSMTEIIDELSDMYVGMLGEERESYKELAADMQSFVDANRQNDIARARALAEELRQSEKADRVLAEQTAKIASMNADFRQKKSQYESQIESIQKENAEKLALMKEDGERAAQRAAQEKADLQERFDDLVRRLENLDAEKTREFQARMDEKDAKCEALEARCDNLVSVNRRHSLLSIFIVIAIAIAMAAIGFIGGEYVHTLQQNQLEQQQQQEQLMPPSDGGLDNGQSGANGNG